MPWLGKDINMKGKGQSIEVTNYYKVSSPKQKWQLEKYFMILLLSNHMFREALHVSTFCGNSKSRSGLEQLI
jgi:hypothetical protein